jgi:eukaryotic-like serine/threonine-protein kinase
MGATTNKQKALWRKDWVVGLAAVLAVLALHQSTDVMGTLERRFYDWASTSSSRSPSDKIAIIAIDDTSIANIGRWPWPRDVHAKLIDQLAAAKAKTVVHTAFFFEPQTERGVDYIRQIKATLPQPPQDGTSDPQEALRQLIAKAEADLDGDAKLAASMKAAGNVLLPSFFTLGQPQGKPDAPLPTHVQAHVLAEGQGFSEPSVAAQHPVAPLAQVAAGLGHLNQDVDALDGVVRREPLLVNYYGQAMPSLALVAAMKSLNLGLTDIRLQGDGDALQLGQLQIATDGAANMRAQFYRGQNGQSPFAVDSFYDVLSGKIAPAKYAGKIVLIGATATGVGVQFPVPGFAALTPVETMAHITSSILNQHFIVQPPWALGLQLAALLLVALYLMVVLPRLSAGMGAGVTTALLLALLVAEYSLLLGRSVWVQMVLPAALLLMGHLALTTKRFLVTEAGKVKSDEESFETNRMMGLALQSQGQLDAAYDRFLRVPLSDPLMGNLNSLAQDFERKRQFNKAQAIYEHMASYNPQYKDLQAKRDRAKTLSETVILGGSTAHPGGSMQLGAGIEKPMLGRYQVEAELGKGAMGVVYKGRDPKIGRVVAIKTMALSQEFEGEDLVDARERFFREAETAGRLQHQNIVTIFDAGEEHDLAYIAMEFLKGKDLTDHTKSGALLPAPQVASIVARVAQALAYAHKSGVVHRDIKPANIMYEPDGDVVKVTDFGIARITDSSKTKTGMVLGTPSFMSPEQIAGQRVDGRSDLYSLGVMLFQLLTGSLPFRGESMAELMFKIANEAAPDPRNWRADLPPALAEICALAMTKRPDLRYQSGEQMAADLLAVFGAAAPPASGFSHSNFSRFEAQTQVLEPKMPDAGVNRTQNAINNIANGVSTEAVPEARRAYTDTLAQRTVPLSPRAGVAAPNEQQPGGQSPGPDVTI